MLFKNSIRNYLIKMWRKFPHGLVLVRDFLLRERNTMMWLRFAQISPSLHRCIYFATNFRRDFLKWVWLNKTWRVSRVACQRWVKFHLWRAMLCFLPDEIGSR